MFDKVNDFLKNLERVSEKYKEIQDSDFEFKWLMNVNMKFFQEVYEVYEKEGNEGAEKYLAEVLRREENFSYIKDSIKEFRYYEDRSDLINQAIKAHSKGNYALSTPVLMAQVDGIFYELGLDLGLWKESEDPTGVKIVCKGEGSPKHISEINEVFREYYGTKIGRDSVRAEVLHGINTDYSDDEVLSAKFIWLLFEALHVSEKVYNENNKT